MMLNQFLYRIWQEFLGFWGLTRFVYPSERTAVFKNIKQLHHSNEDAIQANLVDTLAHVRENLDLVVIENGLGQRFIRSLQNQNVKFKNNVTQVTGRAWFSLRRYHIIDSLLFSAAKFAHFKVLTQLLASLTSSEKNQQLNLSDKLGNTAMMMLADMRIAIPLSDHEIGALHRTEQVSEEVLEHIFLQDLLFFGSNADAMNQDEAVSKWMRQLGLESSESKKSNQVVRANSFLRFLRSTFPEPDLPLFIQQLTKINSSGDNVFTIAVANHNYYFVKAIIDFINENQLAHNPTFQNDLLRAFFGSGLYQSERMNSLVQDNPALLSACLNALAPISGKVLYQYCIEKGLYLMALEIMVMSADVTPETILGFLKDNSQSQDFLNALFHCPDLDFLDKFLNKLGAQKAKLYKNEPNHTSFLSKAVLTGKIPVIKRLVSEISAASAYRILVSDDSIAGSPLHLAFRDADLDMLILMLTKLASHDPEHVIEFLAAPINENIGPTKVISHLEWVCAREALDPEAFIHFFDAILALINEIPSSQKMTLFRKTDLDNQLACIPCENNDELLFTERRKIRLYFEGKARDILNQPTSVIDMSQPRQDFHAAFSSGGLRNPSSDSKSSSVLSVFRRSASSPFIPQ